MDFDPNQPSKVAQTKQFFWATFIPNRRPTFKVYSNRGHALNSFQYRDNAILYNWNGTQWEEVYRIENWKDSSNCERCGDPIKYADRAWIDRHTDSPRLITCCFSCKRKLRA